MKHNMGFICYLGLIGLTACQPRAEFSTDKVSYRGGEPVRVTNTSRHSKSYQWFLNDSLISTVKTPEITLSAWEYGMKVLKLRSVSENGYSSESAIAFSVTPLSGTLTVWSRGPRYEVFLKGTNEARMGTIQKSYSSDPGCNAGGCVTGVFLTGTYTITGKVSTLSVSRVVTVETDACKTLEL